jgi:cyclophilin family peptidyl-prolyl cis-trans isomerase
MTREEVLPMPHANRHSSSKPFILVILAAMVVMCAVAGVSPVPSPRRGVDGDSVRADTTGAAGDSTAGASSRPANPMIRIVLEKGGEIVIETFPDEAPIAVERILDLARDGFYDGLKFHRVESYLVQTGRKETDLPCIEGEMFYQKIYHDPGSVGMARFPDDYDSASTQFYIMKEHRPLLNGEYTLFGRVVRGMDLVMKIKKGWKISKIELLD